MQTLTIPPIPQRPTDATRLILHIDGHQIRTLFNVGPDELTDNQTAAIHRHAKTNINRIFAYRPPDERTTLRWEWKPPDPTSPDSDLPKNTRPI